MTGLSTRHSTSRESGRERVFTDDEAGRLRSAARTMRDAPEAPFSRLSSRPRRSGAPPRRPRMRLTRFPVRAARGARWSPGTGGIGTHP